ncbi:MAG: HlyD family efflux transporter periplasmic adaptor subunit [Chloroflexi bacterium]|nr:HlyD family efflux transporter periplasmic adaptor subunit [Chloroflexota bacterium]
MSIDKDLGALLNERSAGSGRRLRWAAAATLIAVGVLLVYFAFFDGDSGSTLPPQTAVVTRGQLVSTLDTSGTVAAASSGDVPFTSAGEVASIAVSTGQTVEAGQLLATLSNSDALRDLETAQIQLAVAQLRLEDLQTPSAEAVANSEGSLASAQVQFDSAEGSLATAVAGPAASTIAAAEQQTANARAQFASAQAALESLLNPSTADLESAAQAVANAEVQLSAAERSLETLLTPPDPEDFARADQAVFSAQAQFSQAEDALRRLVDGPTAQELTASDASVAQAESSFASAEAGLRAAEANVDTAWANLLGAQDAYCDVSSLVTVCAGSDVPLSSGDIAALTDSIARPNNQSSTVVSRTTTLIQSNASYLSALDGAAGALDSLGVAQASLASTLAARESLLQPTAADLSQAEATFAASEASLNAARAERAGLDEPVSAAQLREAELGVTAGAAALAAAVDRQATLADPSALAIEQAGQNLTAAQLNLDAVELSELWTRSGPNADSIAEADLSLASARASLTAAEARLDQSLNGDDLATTLQQYEVRLAELSLAAVIERVDGLVLVAPRAGIVGAINVATGDTVAAGQVGFVVADPDAVEIALTVSETDFQSIEAGQLGLAQFDALDDAQFVIRVVSISSVPDVAQGVVTYPAVAELVPTAELAVLGPQIAALVQNAGDGALFAGLPPAGGAGGFGAPGGDGGGGRGAGGFGGLELPDGVTIQDVAAAIEAGGPLPDGVELPEGVEQTIRDRIAAGGAGRAPGGGGADGVQAPLADRPSPVVGMTASVTLLLNVTGDVLLIPSTAVRTEDGAQFVLVPSESGEDERVSVTPGASQDGQTIILSGLSEGDVVLTGGFTATTAAPATTTQTPTQPGGGFGGGFGPRGGGGGGNG